MIFQKDKDSSYLIKSTIVLSTGTGIRTICQSLVFLILVRILGVKSYGAYAAVLAIASSLGSFAGFGTQITLVRDVSRNPTTFKKSWGLVLAAIVSGAPLLFGVYLFLSWTLLSKQISWAIIVPIGVAELILAPLALACAYAYQGYERMGRTSRLILAPILPRFIGALLLLLFAVFFPIHTYLLPAWSFLYASAALISATYAVRLVHKDLGLPIQPKFMELIGYMGKSTSFAIGGAAQKLYVDIDKTMLASLNNLETSGAYSAGYRVVDMALIPLRSILTSSIPQFFRAGQKGTANTVGYAVKLLPWPLIYAFICGVVLFFSAKMLPLILGAGYEQAVQVLQYLAWLPLLSLPRLFIQTALSTSGQQRVVVIALVTGAIVNILLNLWLIPSSGWRGAIVSTYMSEILMVSLMLLIIYTKRRKELQEAFLL